MCANKKKALKKQQHKNVNINIQWQRFFDSFSSVELEITLDELICHLSRSIYQSINQIINQWQQGL